MKKYLSITSVFLTVIMGIVFVPGGPLAMAAQKPNILVVWGDDIGQTNISAYTKGLVGYRTPNIDRIANEGLVFTDYYGEQSWFSLFGVRSILLYKLIFLLFAWAGAIFEAQAVLDFGDLMILGMAFPNIFGVVLLSGQIKRELDRYLRRLDAGEFERVR